MARNIVRPFVNVIQQAARRPAIRDDHVQGFLHVCADWFCGLVMHGIEEM